LADGQPIASVAAQPVRAPSPLGRNCLIVDDSRVMRAVSRRVVESLGFLVTEAENGQEALARCGVAMPDLILLDWNMPVMTGIEFITALRDQPGGGHPKVVFCTTENEPAIVGRGIAAGADGFVTKPFDDQTLSAKLQRIGAA
jgi:two-component system, chemotaxis family, chemotaxis protein CheY